MPSSTTFRRTDPVCGTCRKKSRKCDRTRPTCLRCRNKGLVCEGYQLNIQVYDMKNGALRKTRSAKIDRETRASTRKAAETAPPGNTVESMNKVSDRLSANGSTASTSKYLSDSANGLIARTKSPEASQDDLLLYYKTNVVPKLWSTSQSAPNPFEEYILPLAHQHAGLLKAVLGLTACYIAKPGKEPKHPLFTASIQHRLAAMQYLSELLLKEETFGLNESEEEAAMAIVLILVLHDLYDCGRSPNGVHLNGVMFLCARLANGSRDMNSTKLFLITALTWFDLLRGFSGAEKLAFPASVRDFVASQGAPTLNSLVGCPVEIFTAIGECLAAGKKFRANELDVVAFEVILERILKQLRNWNSLEGKYPNADAEWLQLAEAYRQTAILRVLRFPDPYKIPCSDGRIKACVTAILDASAAISRQSTYFKRLLFPLFVAGAEAESPHKQQYSLMCLEHIKEATGISYRRSVFTILEKTWEDRKKSAGLRNVPWFNYTCSKSLTRQHDYLFF